MLCNSYARQTWPNNFFFLKYWPNNFEQAQDHRAIKQTRTLPICSRRVAHSHRTPKSSIPIFPNPSS